MPPSWVWHTAQSPSAARILPRAIISAEKLAGSGGAMGGKAPRMGSASVAMPSAPASAAPAMANHGRRRFSRTGFGAASPESAARTRSGVKGGSRRRTPVASKMALAMAAALGTEADSPEPKGGSSGRGISTTLMTGTSGKVRMG